MEIITSYQTIAYHSADVDTNLVEYAVDDLISLIIQPISIKHRVQRVVHCYTKDTSSIRRQ